MIEGSFEPVDEVHVAQEGSGHALATRARPNPLQERIAEGNDPRMHLGDRSLHDKDSASRTLFMQRPNSGQSTLRVVDDDRLGTIRQHGLDGALDLRIRLEQFTHQSLEPKPRCRLLPALEEMSSAGTDVLPSLDHFS